jgi:DNA ligase-associated metallophosphoesterase
MTAQPTPALQVRSLRIVAAGCPLTLDHSGAVFFEAQKLLVVSDMHLEKGTSWGRRRIFLPPYDTAVTLALLADVMSRYKPETLVFLGDSFHDIGGPHRLLKEDRRLLDTLTDRQDTRWITGNHDPELAEGLCGTSCEELAVGGMLFRHVPRIARGHAFEVSGHLHPVASVSGRGRSVRRRCFATDHQRMILPAFGAYTGGLNIRDAAFKGLFDQATFAAHVIGEKQIYSFPGLPVAR